MKNATISYGPFSGAGATNKPVPRSKKQSGRSPTRQVIRVARGAEARKLRALALELAACPGVSRLEAEAMSREVRS